MTNKSRFAALIAIATLTSACASEVEGDYEDVASATSAIKADKAAKNSEKAADKVDSLAMPDITQATADREAMKAERQAASAEKKAEREAARAAKKAARAAKKALREAERAARFNEGFESYDVGSAPADSFWYAKGNSYVSVTDQQSARGEQSLELVSVVDPASSQNAVGAKVCASVGSESALTVHFKLRMSEPTSSKSWGYIAISNNPTLAAYWWILPNGTITNIVEDFGTLQWNTWNDIRIVVDLADDLATVTLNGVSVSTDISSVWGLIAKPIECLRIATKAQNMQVDQVTIQPEILSL